MSVPVTTPVASGNWLAHLSTTVTRPGRFEIGLLPTLLLLAFYPPRSIYISLPLSIIAIAGIIVPALRHARLPWLAAGVLVAAACLTNWQSTDNHKYLLAYWCLAIFCCFNTSDPERSLARIGRWLIALVFAIAVLQKTLSPDYLTGGFFYYELLFDDRFGNLARYVGGINAFIVELNESARQALVNYDSTLTAVKLSSTDNLLYLAAFITWWNYLIQFAIAVTWLAPASHALARARHPLLLVFLFSTYLFAPVIGFGWVLAIMGIASLDPHAIRTQALYLLAFVLLQVYKLPMIELISGS